MKKNRSISDQVIKNLPSVDDWLDKDFVNKIILLIGKQYRKFA